LFLPLNIKVRPTGISNTGWSASGGTLSGVWDDSEASGTSGENETRRRQGETALIPFTWGITLYNILNVRTSKTYIFYHRI
jgi:hypothetical protein